jgi:hypothetical protein
MHHRFEEAKRDCSQDNRMTGDHRGWWGWRVFAAGNRSGGG